MVSSSQQRSLPTRKNSMYKTSTTSGGRRTLQNTVVTTSATNTNINKDNNNYMESKEKRDLVMAPIISKLMSVKLLHPNHCLPHSELKNIIDI